MTVALDGPPPEEVADHKKYVRSFLFAMRVDSPLAKLHFWTKFVLLFGGSFLLLRLYDQASPDPLGCLIFAVLAFLGLALSGSLRFILKTYLIVILLGMLSVFTNWLIFNPTPGKYTIWTAPVYSGVIRLNISVALLVFILVFIASFRFSKRIFHSLVLAAIPTIALNLLHWNPSFTITQFEFFKPLRILISEITLVVGVTKVFGFMAMILISLLVIMTTRDTEIVGALQQLGLPYKVSFFMSIVFRHLSSAVDDYRTILQAQAARGMNIPKKSILTKLRDLAYIAVPLTITSIVRSRDVTIALEARGFSAARKPTEFHEIQPFSALDAAITIFLVLVAVAIFVTNINFTYTVGLERLWE